MRILIVEDDEKIAAELSLLLTKSGYQALVLGQFGNVVEDVLNSHAQLVLLDINLPFQDGYYICKEIRKRSSVPIIIVTSRANEIDELTSMHLGADDFVTKPYNTQILLARISSLLKRTYQQDYLPNITRNGVCLDVVSGMVQFQNQSVELSKNELRILSLLMQKAGKVVSREEIINDLWQSDEFIDDNTLTVNINRLRKKLESIGIENFLLTKRGLGYMVCA